MSAAVDGLVGTVRDAQEAFVGLRDTVNQTVGRDIENDLANLGRIGATGGLTIVSDLMGDLGLAGEDLQRVLQDTGESVGLLHEDFVSYTGEVDKAKNAMATLPAAFHEAAGAAEDTGATVDDLTEAIARAENQAKKMAAAFDTVASVSITDIRSDFKSLQESIALAAKSNSWSALNRQYKQLAAQRRRYFREGEYDTVAIIDAAIKENRTQVNQRRLSSLLYRAEAGDQKAIRTISRQVASSQKRDQAGVQGALKDTLQKVEDLKAGAEEGATLDVDVNALALDLLEQRLAVLRGGIVVPITTSGSGALPPSGSGASGGIGGTINVKTTTNVSAHAINKSTDRVTSSRRSGGYAP